MNRFYVYRMLDIFNCAATYVNLSFNSHGSTVNSALAVESLTIHQEINKPSCKYVCLI